MRHPKTRALYDYWNALRDGRLAPGRNEVDPREIAPLLDSTFILEVQNADNIRFRLAGTRLCEAFGMELRGMSALALWHGEDRAKVRDLILRVVSGPTIGHVACTVENRGGFVYSAEFLYMPLRSDRDELTRILGCGYYMGEERAFANVYDPIHHWVDAVNLYPIDSDEAAEDLPAQRLFTRPGPAAAPEQARRDPFRAPPPRDPARDPFRGSPPFRALQSAPVLTAIDGGRKPGGLRPFRLEEGDGAAKDSALRDRGHLRLVKSDAV
ncbi:PAS domain-containing protein [Neomegalonema perideroedes]|uniref:PAS domain-containing protein n=1 Tax=Neomegalonema perideroedes TaxID=217219 RepID=UPI00036ABCC3|nr:PAS domain-containing protein [Neomegalonema perideroedes]